MNAVVLEQGGILSFYEGAKMKFSELINNLKNSKAHGMGLSELETLIDKEGRELLRQLLQDHIDSRGNGDLGLSLDGADKINRSHKRIGTRQIKSIFGSIELERLGYGARGTNSLFPKDGQLSLPETSHSYELQKLDFGHLSTCCELSYQ